MSLGLILTLTGLALVDSINVSTIWVVVIILLAARRPAATGWAYAIGAFATFLAFTLLLFFGLTFAGDLLADLTLWMRRILFSVVAVVLAIMGARKLKSRPRRGYGLPAWINPWTALPLGLLATIADIPNAFPMFLAIERLIDANIGATAAIPILVGYTAIYAIPTIAVLVVGLIFKDRLRDRLQRLYNRYATGDTKPSWKLATLFFAGAGLSVAILVFVIR